MRSDVVLIVCFNLRLSHVCLRPSKALVQTFSCESIRLAPVMPVGMVKQKDVVELGPQILDGINAVFHLEDHVVILPVSLIMGSILKLKQLLLLLLGWV